MIITNSLQNSLNIWKPSSKLRLHVVFARIPRNFDKNSIYYNHNYQDLEYFVYIQEFQAYCFLKKSYVKLLRSKVTRSEENGMKIYEMEISLNKLQDIMLFKSNLCPELFCNQTMTLFDELMDHYADRMKNLFDPQRFGSPAIIEHLSPRMKSVFKYKQYRINREIGMKKTPKTPEEFLTAYKRKFGLQGVTEVDECILCGKSLSITLKHTLICSVCRENLIADQGTEKSTNELEWKIQKRYLPESLTQDPLEIRFEVKGIKCGKKTPKLANRRIPYFYLKGLQQVYVYYTEIIDIIQQMNLIIQD